MMDRRVRPARWNGFFDMVQSRGVGKVHATRGTVFFGLVLIETRDVQFGDLDRTLTKNICYMKSTFSPIVALLL